MPTTPSISRAQTPTDGNRNQIHAVCSRHNSLHISIDSDRARHAVAHVLRWIVVTTAGLSLRHSVSSTLVRIRLLRELLAWNECRRISSNNVVSCSLHLHVLPSLGFADENEADVGENCKEVVEIRHRGECDRRDGIPIIKEGGKRYELEDHPYHHADEEGNSP